MQRLAIELKPKRVNVISPGVVNSATWSSMGEEERTPSSATSLARFLSGAWVT